MLRLRLEPGVDQGDAEIGEVPGIAGDQAEVVLEPCRRDDSIHDTKRKAGDLPLGF